MSEENEFGGRKEISCEKYIVRQEKEKVYRRNIYFIGKGKAAIFRFEVNVSTLATVPSADPRCCQDSSY